MTESLINHFLIAMPNINDPRFHRSVILVAEHNAKGAMGVIINQPTDLSFNKIFEQFDIKATDEQLLQQKILRGGPLKREHGFILHKPLGEWRATTAITDELGITTSRDILTAMVEQKGPEEVLIILGCAGWEAGQLEEELRENVWLTVPANTSIIFNCPYHDRWNKAAGLIGIDVDRLCEAGHA